MVATNHLNQQDRIHHGKAREAQLLRLLNLSGPVELRDTTIVNWRPSTQDEDMHAKVDAWGHTTDEDDVSAQLKVRETGRDLGIALIRPWHEAAFLEGDIEWDRDMHSTPGVYAALIGLSVLVVVKGSKVHRAAEVSLDRLYKAGGFGDRRGFSPCRGVELRLVRDRGTGYSAGQEKVVLYLSPALLVNVGAVVKKVG